MNVFCSLQFFREILVAIHDRRGGNLDTLSVILLKSNYFARVYCGILSLDERTAGAVKKDLEVFLDKFKMFIRENPKFSSWWPEKDSINQAFVELLSGRGNEAIHFTLIVAIVIEFLKIIENYEALLEIRKLSLQ